MLFLMLFGLTACSSAKRDDYTQHLNQLHKSGINYQHVNFNFQAKNLDLRGDYIKDDSAANATHMTYVGNAGVVGVFAQMAVHSAIINEEREAKLLKAQQEANHKIAPIIKLSQSISLDGLIKESSTANPANSKYQPVKVKPIFFCNDDMTKFHLKAVAWIEDKDYNDEHIYRNLFSVHRIPLDEAEKQRLLDGDSEYLKTILSQLLSTSLHLIKEDVKGHYVLDRSKQQSFVYNRKLFRGQLVEKYKGYDVIKDIRSWLIAYPNISYKLQ